MSREARILELIEEYEDGLQSGRSEAEINQIIDTIEELVPHANFSDLMFWPERDDRTFEEMAKEAEFREDLWEQGGWQPLLSHIEHLMAKALSKEDLTPAELHGAEGTLAYFRKLAGQPESPTIN